MKKFIRVFLPTGIFSLGIIVLSCNNADHRQNNSHENVRTPVPLSYAKGFEIWESNGTKEVKINSGVPYLDAMTFVLVPPGATGVRNIAGPIIEVPVENIVVTSTSHLPFLDLLQVTDYLVGFPNTTYISSNQVRKRVDQGLVAEVGTVNGINFESLIALNPELVVTYLSGSDHSELDQLEQSGIPWILNLDFMEETPLGRAEWIKFMGLLTGEFDRADSVFRGIEKEYLRLLALTDTVTQKPTVFSGIMYGDTWYAPGAKSFAASFIQDAAGNYTWSDLNRSGSVELSLEAVLDRNIDTQFWIGAGEYSSFDHLAQSDPRYGHFQAFQTGKIFNYHRRIGATGGFEYLELGGARPDLVLADIIKILHPELLPHHQMYFYKKLD